MEGSNQKSLTINDILDQLTKPSVIQPPEASKPSAPIPPAIKIPTVNTPNQTVRPPSSTGSTEGIRLPQLGKPSDSKTDSVSTPNPKPQSDFRMSIRTMSADMARLKQGQAPQVFELNKPTLQSQKTASAQPPPPPSTPPPPPPKPAPKQPAPSISAIPIPIPRPTTPIIPPQDIQRPSPSQSFKPSPRPSANMQNNSPVPPIGDLPSHAPESKEAEHHHTERIISTDSLPGFPGAPVPKKTAKPPDEKLEYGLIAKVIGSGMTTGIISTIVIALATYLLLTYFFFNQQDEIITATPTPTQSISSTPPATNELENIFRAIPADDFYLPDNKEEAIPALISFIKSKVLGKKEFRKIAFIKSPNQSEKISEFTELLDAISLNYPGEFKESINPNHLVLFYGQEEKLDQSLSDEFPKRIVMVVEIKDIDKTIDIMKRWEPNMPEDFKDLFEIDPTKKASQTFLDNQYQGTKIRYQNFPLPDKSVDYAIVSSLTGRHYLIITNSRESAYSPIDRIKGL